MRLKLKISTTKEDNPSITKYFKAMKIYWLKLDYYKELKKNVVKMQ